MIPSQETLTAEAYWRVLGPDHSMRVEEGRVGVSVPPEFVLAVGDAITAAEAWLKEQAELIGSEPDWSEIRLGGRDVSAKAYWRQDGLDVEMNDTEAIKALDDTK